MRTDVAVDETERLPAIICGGVRVVERVTDAGGDVRGGSAFGRLSLRAVAPLDPLREELLSVDGVDAVDIKGLDDEPGVLSVTCKVASRDGIEAGIARVVAARWDLHRLERQEPTLENIFLHYVGQSKAESEVAA